MWLHTLWEKIYFKKISRHVPNVIVFDIFFSNMCCAINWGQSYKFILNLKWLCKEGSQLTLICLRNPLNTFWWSVLKLSQHFCFLKCLKGAFINDVTQILRISDPSPPSVTLKWLFHLQLYSDCQKRVNPPLPPSCVTSFMNAP